MGRLHCEYEDDILDRWHAEMEKQRSRSASYLIARREKAKLLPAAPVVKKVPCPSCEQSFDSKKSLSNHKRACSAPARVTHPPDRMTRRRVLNLDESDGEDPAEEVPPVAVDPKEREERWVDPLPEKLQFQQQVNKIAELKCKYSRANAKVRWYKDRKKLFSDGLKYTILLDKQSVTLIINNPDPDDSGKYTCKANGMPTNSFVTVEGPSIKYVFLTPLPNTMDIYRTKPGVLTCKLNSPRAPLVWQRDGKPIDVDDPRYQIENDAVGRFTLTIRVVEQIDQGMWTATVNKDVNSKCQVSVVEEPRDFVETLKSQSANENENVTFECVVNDEDIDVEWFHGDAKIKMDGRHFKEERVGCHRRLLITNLRIEDQGQYKCTTKNDKTMAQLIVDPLKKFECEAGKQKQIKVPFEVKGTRRGDPKPILLRNGKPVDLSKMKDLVEVIINGTVAEIVFKDPQKSEAGKWSLKLENTGGVSTEAAFELVVKGKPKTPKVPVDTLDVTSDSCAFLRGANEELSQQLHDEMAAEMALRRVNDEHETESSDVDEDEYVVESDDDIPAVEANAGAFPGTSTLSATARTTRIYTAAAPVAELCGKERRSNKNSDLGTSGTSARIVETPGELAILKCVVEGNPAPKFAWKKGGREVPLTDDRLRCQTDGDTRTRKAKAPLNVPGPPGPPKPLHTAYNSITLQWAQPLRDGGTPITGYELEKREHGTNAQWEKAAFGSVPDTQFKVTGVKQYHFYEFRVAAVNAVGQGEWSDNSVPIAATRSSCKPLITMGMLARENDLGSDSVDLRLEVVDRPAPPEGSLKVLPELVVSKYQVPSQPDKPVVRDFGRTWAELEWELPASNGGAKIRGYELQHKEKHSEWITCKKSGTWATNFKVKNLIDRGEYQFRVAARNEAGLSKPSLPSDRIKLPGPPGMPIQVEAQSIGPNCVTLTWQPPAEDGGSKLEGYLVQKREWDHEQWEKATPDMCPLTECLVSGLREFQAYVFRVIAVNLHGCSTPSLHTLPINIVETAGACPTIVINKELSVQGPSVVPLKSQRANEKEKDATQIRTPKTAQPSSAHGIGPSLDSSDQPLSSTARRCQPRRSARKDATDIQCENLTPPRPKNTERTTSGSGRRRVGSTAADRQAQAAAAACAAGEEAPNEEGRQDVAVVTKKNAILALRRVNDEHETESSDIDEDEYVVESDDDIPAVEHRSSVDMRRESLAEILDLGTSGTPARIGASLFPGKHEERWVDPLPEKLQFQQQKNKIAELKCKYSRANAKVRWYKGRKELFSDGLKYKILIDKQSVTLIINNPDPDDSGKYKCEANGVPTNSFVTVEGPSIKYVFLTPLPNTMEIYRTKQGILTCKLNSARAPLVWQRDDEKPIDVHDPRYQIEKDAAGCFTLTIRVVEQIDQGMWTATVNKNVISKCQVYVVEDPRDTFVVPEQLRNETAANEVGPSTPEIVALLNLSKRFDETFERRRRHAMNPIQHSQLSDDGAGTSMTSDVSVQDYASSEFDLDAFLQICAQTEVHTWKMLGELSSFNKWSKIGEGAFGEVFKGTLENAPIAFKVIPFAASEEQCSKLVNGENLKPAKFIFNELYITNELSKLSAGNDFVTPTFIQLRMSKIIKGCFPSKLLKAWDAFKKAKPEKVENKRPDTYAEEGLHFLIIGLSYGGIDLKAYTIPNSHVCYSIFLQIALSLAVAERVLGFEHRDLHDENFLLEECAPDEKMRYKYDGAKIDVVSHGVRVSIIDYSISRLQKENVVVYADLSQDPGLFEQNGEKDGGDYQYDVYRMMKAAISDDGWASFCPQTNLYWLDYAAKKLFNNRFIRREKKEVIRRLFCPQYQNKFKTTRDFTVDPKFLTVFAKYISK
ncbi:hypothetical protein niasHT_004430 [Heterodera trifolii]|uniref:Non-specific serine/threonine protein kinase n=1 Tax=Heterodera trifolii TaxID=157864 RepID=A0ABD2LPM0_9BILA